MNYTYFVDITSWYFIVFMVSMFLGTAVSSFIDWLNSDKGDIRSKLNKLREIDPVSNALFTYGRIRKSLEYKRVSESFSDMVGIIKSGMSTIFTIFGIIPFTISLFMHFFPNIGTVWCWIMTACVSMILSTAIFMLPDYYKTFSIEERFGFNKTTKKTFFSDTVKGLLVGIAMLIPLQFIFDLILKYVHDKNCVGIVSFVVFLISFGYVFRWFCMYVVMPMFNKFNPLENESLKNKLMNLCDKCGLKNVSIEVMDASRRSKHSNAFIFGIFGKKRIVIFDNMLETMTEDEIVSVVAHEIGHGKLHHLAFKNIQGVFSVTAVTFIVFSLMKIPSFYNAFGYSWVNEANITDNMIIGFSIASAFITSFMWVLSPIANWISRKMEYAADRYACSVIENPKTLSTALLKLYSSNLSDIFPHPVYEFFNYSHPSVLNRIRKILEWK